MDHTINISVDFDKWAIAERLGRMVMAKCLYNRKIRAVSATVSRSDGGQYIFSLEVLGTKDEESFFVSYFQDSVFDFMKQDKENENLYQMYQLQKDDTVKNPYAYVLTVGLQGGETVYVTFDVKQRSK